LCWGETTRGGKGTLGWRRGKLPKRKTLPNSEVPIRRGGQKEPSLGGRPSPRSHRTISPNDLKTKNLKAGQRPENSNPRSEKISSRPAVLSGGSVSTEITQGDRQEKHSKVG